MKRDMHILCDRTLRHIGVAIASVVIVSCGGGAGTEALPQLNLPTVQELQRPAARV